MKKKLITALILTASAILLVCASVLGTLAFLASSFAVSNTFTYGDVGIQMFESKTDENGNYVDNNNNVIGASYTVNGLKTSDGNSYKLVPGKSYVKDPTIYVKEGSVPSYLFVKIKNGISTIEKADTDHPTIKDQMIALGWQEIKSNASGEVLYIYVGKDNATNSPMTGAVAAKPVGSTTAEKYDLFSSFTVAENAVVADFAGAKVTLTAFAIQTEGFTEEKDGLQGYQRAWNAIVGRFPFESGTVYTATNN